MPLQKRQRRGVSLLLEILFGLGLFAIGLLYTLGLFPTAASSLTQAKDVSLATNLARNVMETQLQLPYAVVASVAPDNVTFTTVNKGAVTTQLFTYQVDVTPVGAEPLKSVVVNVSWQYGSINRQTYLQSYKGQNL